MAATSNFRQMENTDWVATAEVQRRRSRSLYVVEVVGAAYAGIHGCLGPFAYASILKGYVSLEVYISGGVVVIVSPIYWSEISTT